MKCPTCNGTGKFPLPTNLCSVCKGQGMLADDRSANPSCPLCRGSGRYPLATTICSQCQGYGKLPSDESGLMAIHIQPGTQRTSHLQLVRFFKELKGDLRICDPYYGSGTLFRLDQLTDCSSVRFLTKNLARSDENNKPAIKKAYQEFCKQYRQFEFRLGNKIHDRYILTDDSLILLGHGLTDIGGKESFVVKLSREIAGDLMESVGAFFDKEWERANPLF